MMKDFHSRVLSIEKVATDTKKLILTKPEDFNFQAGQFLMIKFEKKLMRAYSIASTPTEKKLELIIRIIPNGQGSTIIDQSEVGDNFTIAGPVGHFILTKNPQAELFFCATGTGIAPIKSIIKTENLKKIPRKMTLFYGGKNQEDLAYLEELNSWSKDLNIKLAFSQQTLSEINLPDLKNAEIGNCRITNFIRKEKFSNFAEFYICGNKNMVLETKDLLLDKEVDSKKIFFERFN